MEERGVTKAKKWNIALISVLDLVAVGLIAI